MAMLFLDLIFFFQSLLYTSTDRTVVRVQDEVSVISDVASNVEGRRLAFDFIDQNWDYFLKT